MLLNLVAGRFVSNGEIDWSTFNKVLESNFEFELNILFVLLQSVFRAFHRHLYYYNIKNKKYLT